MIPSHAELYRSLTTQQASALWSRLHSSSLLSSPPPDDADGEELAARCSHLSHAEVVLTMSRDSDPFWVELMSCLLRRPLYLCARGETGSPPTDILGRPLATPVGHRLGEPVSERTALVSPELRRRTRSAPRTDHRVITAVVPNPKLPSSASFQRFALYEVGITVSEYVARGGRSGDIAYDAGRGFITLGV